MIQEDRDYLFWRCKTNWHNKYHHYINDWLNAHHFDFRNLIEKGLAIEVTKENNPYEA